MALVWDCMQCARAHGGDLVLENRLHGGLQAILSLLRN